jgi:RNA polymerase sigma-70 factor (sigma-E family)
MDPAADAEFTAYVAARSPALMRVAYLLCGHRADAEDLLQTALTKTYLAYPRIRASQALDAYVRRTLVTTHISIWRRPSHRREITVDTPPEPNLPTSIDLSDAVAGRDALWVALSRLGKRQRAVIVLRFYEDLTEAQVAETLGIKVGTVKSQSARALATLRREAGLADTFFAQEVTP